MSLRPMSFADFLATERPMTTEDWNIDAKFHQDNGVPSNHYVVFLDEFEIFYRDGLWYPCVYWYPVWRNYPTKDKAAFKLYTWYREFT